MANTNKDQNKGAEFNGQNEREALNEQFHEEHDGQQDKITKTENELSMGDSIRNYGEVSGTTFGMESNTAKFSNTGQKNQNRKGEGDANIEDVNRSDRESGSGGTMYSDYLNQSQNQFISGTGQFSDTNNQDSNSGSGTDNIKPSDAMQGNRGNSTDRNRE